MAIRALDSKYKLSQKFGIKNSNYRLGYHPGDDYATPVGVSIKASDNGRATYQSDLGDGYGNTVTLELANGDTIFHAHLSAKGLTGLVKKGEVIGKSGNTGWTTGPHVHIEHRIKGSMNQPRSYEAYLKANPEKPAPKPSGTKTYIVKKNDTLTAIARNHSTTVKTLAALNNITNPNIIRVGQVLVLPTSASKPVYDTVRKGEGVSHLAKRAGYSDWRTEARWLAIAKLNGKTNWGTFNSSLKTNQKVRVR